VIFVRDPHWKHAEGVHQAQRPLLPDTGLGVHLEAVFG